MDFKEKFIEKNIAELAKRYDMIAGANKNIARITPELIDGLKPVQRRAIYVMYKINGGRSFRKVTPIAGDVMSQAHPHSPVAIEDAIINMAQWWNNSVPLIEPFGNFGNCFGDRAGAGRYIQARLSEYCIACFFEDWKESVVDMTMSYNEETLLPEYLPAKYPNILLNGCLGIGYGLGTNIPSYNFREVVEATIMLMRNSKADIVLIPDSTTYADIIEQDFAKLCNTGLGSYKQRCTYEIDAENNIVTLTSLPHLTSGAQVREKIADIKDHGGMNELVDMNDLSKDRIEMQLVLRDTANPYKFVKKLIKEVPGLERTYPVSITVVNNYENRNYSIKQLLLDWIEWRREQKRSVINNKRATLTADQRTNDVKIFIMNKNNLEKTVHIFRTSHNREEIEKKLIDTYKNTSIRMDSLQARALSNMRMIELTIDAYNACVEHAEELKKHLDEIDEILNSEDGIDKIIIGELRDGMKRFGTPRRSNVVPERIEIKNDVEGTCILQLSSDGMLLRKLATNAEEEPIPTDTNGFACLVDNDSSFIIVTDDGSHSFIKANDIPVDTEVPVSRYARKDISGNIIALLPIDMERDLCVTLISEKGLLKKIRVLDIKKSSKKLMSLDDDDRLVRGVALNSKSAKDVLVYTNNGMGQRLDPNNIRITSPNAKGTPGFKLADDDKIIGVYTISPDQNAYLLYVTMKGKVRLNNIKYLPTRNNKHDQMVKLIDIPNRDKLVAVIGCNKYDKATVFYDDGDSEEIDISKLHESTMSEEPKKITKKNAVSNNVTKVKIL